MRNIRGNIWEVIRPIVLKIMNDTNCTKRHTELWNHRFDIRNEIGNIAWEERNKRIWSAMTYVK